MDIIGYSYLIKSRYDQWCGLAPEDASCSGVRALHAALAVYGGERFSMNADSLRAVPAIGGGRRPDYMFLLGSYVETIEEITREYADHPALLSCFERGAQDALADRVKAQVTADLEEFGGSYYEKHHFDDLERHFASEILSLIVELPADRALSELLTTRARERFQVYLEAKYTEAIEGTFW
jgi:hypothetical protein